MAKPNISDYTAPGMEEVVAKLKRGERLKGRKVAMAKPSVVKVWLTRDDVGYDIHTRKSRPRKQYGGYIDASAFICSKVWEKFARITLKPGECVRAEFTYYKNGGFKFQKVD